MLQKPDAIKLTLQLAEQWQTEIEKQTSKAQIKEQNKLARLVQDQKSKNILICLFDQAFRSTQSVRVVEQFKYLLKKHGNPKSFTRFEIIMLGLFQQFGSLIPSISLFFLKKNILSQTSKVLLDDDPKKLESYIARKRSQGIKLNLNLLGELVLGEKEAMNRFNDYRKALKNPQINYISIKPSCICSQLKPLAYRHSKNILKSRLSTLYREAKNNSETIQPKFVNLDMEEYKDLRLTYEIFTEVLEEEEFYSLNAGIVIQAYLPDAFLWYQKLLSWAKARVSSGGAPVKMRLVKGANLQMEEVESSLHNWECPVFDTKLETDASYKKILEMAILPENIQAVNLGVASHNLFDIAYASVLADAYQIKQGLSFEMLEGISESSTNCLQKKKKDFVIYAPVSGKEEFINAITYLIRRLDENSGQENFLRYSFNMKLDSENWQFLKNQFLSACELIPMIDSEPKRKQNRLNEKEVNISQWNEPNFENEAETDFNLENNLLWAESISQNWLPHPSNLPEEILIQVGQENFSSAKFKDFFSQNQNTKVHTYRVYLSEKNFIQRTIQLLEENHQNWTSLKWQKRCDMVSAVANQLRKKRGKLIGVMAKVTEKVFSEGDNEVTEAIDFAEYYPYSLKKLHEEIEFTEKGKGIVLVISPWNFPTAIPTGGILASLVAGNSVVLKPAPEAMPIAWELAQCFWDAGVPKEVFQVINCDEGEDLEYLVKHKSIKQIIFTGGTETLYKILNNRNDILVSAETGGKNSIIVTSIADWDKAIKDIVQSAFSNSGQKCSAASLLILEKELFDSAIFKQKLIDATTSLLCGRAFEIQNDMSSLVSKPNDKIKHALECLEDGEEWLIEPKFSENNPKLLYPCIKWNVKKSGFSYKEELFAPILSVMRAEDFNDALDLVNKNFGLTSGLQSLDEREIEIWKNRIKAGNLYINRGITGAIVQRQAFGGFLNSKSAFGLGIKAGGPNYLLQLMDIEITKTDKNRESHLPEFLEESIFSPVKETLKNYQWWLKNFFNRIEDPSKILGQDNYLKYLKGEKPILLKVTKTSDIQQVLLILGAMFLCETKCVIWVDVLFSHLEILERLNQHFKFYYGEETLEDLEGICMVRTDEKASIPKEFRLNCAQKGIQIISHQPILEGRIELIYYLQEQSISEDYHRYGNLGFRERVNN